MNPGIGYGFFLPLKALKFFFRNLGLSRFFLFPLLINIVIFGLGTWAFIHYFDFLAQYLISPPEAWYQYIFYYLIKAGLVLAFLAIVIFGFTMLGSIIASPFLGVLSEKVEEIASEVKIDEKLSVKLVVTDAWDAVTTEIKKLGMLIGIQLALLLLNLLPGIGTAIYVVLSPTFVVFFLAFEYLDFTLSRKRMPFKEKWRLIWKHKAPCVGMGLAFFFTTVVPFVNFFVLPAAVTSATLLYVEIAPGEPEKASF